MKFQRPKVTFGVGKNYTERGSIRNDHSTSSRLPFLVPSLGAHSTKASNAVYTISYANWSHVLRDKSELTIGKSKAFVQFFQHDKKRNIFLRKDVVQALKICAYLRGLLPQMIPCDDQITSETTWGEPCCVPYTETSYLRTKDDRSVFKSELPETQTLTCNTWTGALWSKQVCNPKT